jgi:hypothetical protein
MDELFETGAAAVFMHGVLNDLGVIGFAARTLDERWDDLPARTRSELLATIRSSVEHGMERVRLVIIDPASVGTDAP